MFAVSWCILEGSPLGTISLDHTVCITFIGTNYYSIRQIGITINNQVLRDWKLGWAKLSVQDVSAYTANVYWQTTDKLMFKSVISTFRWIRKYDTVKYAINKQNILIFN